MNTAIDFASLPFVHLVNKGALPQCMALYFVLRGEEVLYIGKTENLRNRWSSHHKLAKLENIGLWDIRISWFLFEDATLLDATELALIKHYEPELNGRLHDNSIENLKLGAIARKGKKSDRKPKTFYLNREAIAVLKKAGPGNQSRFIEKLIQAHVEKRLMNPAELFEKD